MPLNHSDKGEKQMFGKHTVYSSEELIFLRRVLDEAVASLPVRLRTPAFRTRIAKRIIECAATGERSRVELRIAGLADFSEIGESVV
jgi:hypothetical protein